MAIQRGSEVATSVETATKSIGTGAWTALQVGSTPKKGRRHLQIQVKAGPGGACALQFADASYTGSNKGKGTATFTTPTDAAKGSITYPGNSIVWLPVSDNVTVYGRLVQKKGFTDNSVQIAIVEYS